MRFLFLNIIFLMSNLFFLGSCRQVREKSNNVRITEAAPLGKDTIDNSIIYVTLREKGSDNLYSYDMKTHDKTLLVKDFPAWRNRSDFHLNLEKKIGLIVSDETRIRVFSTSGEKHLFDKSFSKRVGNATLSPDGKWFAFFKRPTGSSKVSDEVTIVNVSTGEVRIAPALLQQECSGLFWSADSSKIITSSNNPESKGELTDWTITEVQSLRRTTQQAEPFLYTNTRSRGSVAKKNKSCPSLTRYSFKADDDKDYREATGIEILKNKNWKSIMHFEVGPEVISTDVEMPVGQPSPTCEVFFYPIANELFLIDLKTEKFIKLFDKSQKPELIQISQPL